MRPANIVTAMADILLGFAAATASTLVVDKLSDFPATLGWLILSTIGLYGGGVVLNDVFDAKLDAVERPERPIPIGIVPIQYATWLGGGLLIMGIVSAFQSSTYSGILAIIISILVLLYDALSKHHPITGPINMGLCRAFNLLLGISIVPMMVIEVWYLAIIPMVYIYTITMISRGEVHGGSKVILSIAIVLYTIVIAAILSLGFLPTYNLLYIIPFIILFLYLTFPNLLKAYKNPGAMEIRNAVKGCIIALIALDATIAAGFAGWLVGLLIICLLPISFFLAKAFAVT